MSSVLQKAQPECELGVVASGTTPFGGFGFGCARAVQ
jgi:hypothetical protein